MDEPLTSAAPQDLLAEFMAQPSEQLMSGPEWSASQALDLMRMQLNGFLGELDDAQKRDYVRLQRAWIDAQHTLEQCIRQLTAGFEQQALATLRVELKSLTGQVIDPMVAQIHTRYLKPADRARRAVDEAQGVIKLASVSLWNAACLNYDGLTGWSYPGHTGLADASYLDTGINATAAEFIALVRRLDIGGQLKQRLDQALQGDAALGLAINALAATEFEFALIEALRNSPASRVDRHQYQQLKRALAGEVQWGSVEEVRLFIPHGMGPRAWIPRVIGFSGQYVTAPLGDSLSIPHLVFSVEGCDGAFSFFPNRPGGALRHHANHGEASEVFHRDFRDCYREGQVEWLYQVMLLRDCAQLKQVAKRTAPPRDLEGFAKLIYSLAQAIPKPGPVNKIGYTRNGVQTTPLASLHAFYIKRCRANLQELANETPGFMPALIELFQTLLSEVLNVLLIPAPGALKGLGRVRAVALFVVLGQGLVEGGDQALRGEPGELLQTLVDLADLLISSRLNTGLVKRVKRRHQRLYQHLSQPRVAAADPQTLSSPQLLERMLGTEHTPQRDLQQVLDTSATSRADLDKVWAGERPSASLVEAVQRFRADRQLDWVPDHGDQPVPAVISQLQALHPELSLTRLLEVLRGHPLSAHQQTQLLHSQLQPEALYQALRDARRVVRRQAIVDGLFHPRRFNRQTQRWATQFAPAVLHDLIGQVVVVSPAGQAVPYVSKGARDQTLVVIDQRHGRFSPYDHHQARTGAMLTGADGFYAAIINQLSADALLRLGWSTQQAVSELRYQVGQALLRNRAPDGSFYPVRRQIAAYASAPIVGEPDSLGIYRREQQRYLFIEGAFYALEPTPWRIRHPSLNDAYAPRLAHNGAGAWRHEWENPLTWDGQKPFYRLGPLMRALTPDAIEQIQQISAVTPDILRRMHLRNERPPLMLVDSVERFNCYQRVEAGMAAGREFLESVLDEISYDSADALVGRAGVERADQLTVLEAKVALDAFHMQRLFFKTLSHQRERSSDPLAQVLLRDFLGLTAAIAEDLVRDVTPVERASLLAGKVPPSLNQGIRWWLEYLRKSRAMEGVHLPAAASEDSARLILHTLTQIPGWPAHLRVEVWERGYLRDSIGAADAPLIRVLEAVAGQYQAYLPRRQPMGSRGPFMAVLLDALPAKERQALAYVDADELTQEIGHRLTRHWEFADTLLEIGRRPWHNPPRRLADGRIGYPLSGGDDLGPAERAQVARLRELFPVKSNEDALTLLQDISHSLSERDEAIDALFKEREVLHSVLDRWSAEGDTAQVAARREAAGRIRQCWAREVSTRGVPFELQLNDLGLTELPVLTAHFGHVMQLNVRNNVLETLPPRFLRCFTALRALYLDGNRLQQVPQGVSGLVHVQHLTLANNRIRPNFSDTQRLQTLTQLTKLDLSHNPIGQGARLNLQPLQQLQVVRLRNARLHLLPLGVQTLAHLRTFDLRDNQLNVLTDNDFDLGLRAHRALNLEGNELSQASLQLLSFHRLQPGYQHVDFGLWRDGAVPLPSVERWLVPIPLQAVPLRRAEWALLAGEQMAECFFDLVWALASYPPLIATEHRALRDDITRRVWQVIDNANHNGRLQQILFDTRLHYMSGGIDGFLLCLNDIELAMLPVQMLAGDVENAGADFLHYYRARRRLASIDQHLMRASPQLSDPVLCAHILAYRIALAQGLDLPLPMAGRFGTTTAVPGSASVTRLREAVLREEIAYHWPRQLQGEEYWVEFLERKYPLRFNTALRRYHRAFELAAAKVDRGDMTELEYKDYIEILRVPMERAKAALISTLTLREWEAFVIG